MRRADRKAAARSEHRLDVLEWLLWAGNEPKSLPGYPSVLERLEAVEGAFALPESLGGLPPMDEPLPAMFDMATVSRLAGIVISRERALREEAEAERDHLRDFKRRAHEALDEIGVDACVGEDCRIVARIRALANRRSQDRPPGMAACPCSAYGVRDHPAHVWMPRSCPWSPDQTARGVPPGIAWCPGQSST